DELSVTRGSSGGARPVRLPDEFHVNPNLPPGLRPAVRVDELPAELGGPRDDQRHLRSRIGNPGETGAPAGVVPRVEEGISSIADAEPDPALVVGRLRTEVATGGEEKGDTCPGDRPLDGPSSLDHADIDTPRAWQDLARQIADQLRLVLDLDR